MSFGDRAYGGVADIPMGGFGRHKDTPNVPGKCRFSPWEIHPKWEIYREPVYFLEAHFEAEYIDGKMRMYISYREPTGNL